MASVAYFFHFSPESMKGLTIREILEWAKQAERISEQQKTK